MNTVLLNNNIEIKIQKPTYKGYESLSLFMNDDLIGKLFVKHLEDYPIYKIKNYKISWKNDIHLKYPKLTGVEKNFTEIKDILEYIAGTLKNEFPDSNIVIDNGYPKVYSVISDRNGVNFKTEIITKNTKEGLFIGHSNPIIFDENGIHEEHGHGTGFEAWSWSHFYFLDMYDANVKFIEEEERINGEYKDIFSMNYIKNDLKNTFPDFTIHISGLREKQLICKKTVTTKKGFIDARIIVNESDKKKCKIEISSRESDVIDLKYNGLYINGKNIKSLMERHIKDSSFFNTSL